jgi:hypothetical protein
LIGWLDQRAVGIADHAWKHVYALLLEQRRAPLVSASRAGKSERTNAARPTKLTRQFA